MKNYEFIPSMKEKKEDKSWLRHALGPLRKVIREDDEDGGRTHNQTAIKREEPSIRSQTIIKRDGPSVRDRTRIKSNDQLYWGTKG
ncbi:MAG: hypothetical protein PHU23_10065 [Dehalococcoidales bacterium]|nr:hypothetical protein [Dehalococcoidales bacterium]